MGLFSSTRQRLFHYAVALGLQEKILVRKTIPFSLARRIGILFRANTDEDQQSVMQFSEKLRVAGKQVDILGYTDRKKTRFPEPVKTLDRSQVSWIGVPSSPDADYFENQEFDILICAWLGRCLPLRHIALFSRAAWRVGEFSPDKEHSAEFLIRLPDDRQNLEAFFFEVDHYLHSIHSHESQQQTV